MILNSSCAFGHGLKVWTSDDAKDQRKRRANDTKPHHRARNLQPDEPAAVGYESMCGPKRGNPVADEFDGLHEPLSASKKRWIIIKCQL